MIKCPNCGSSAQVKMGNPTLSDNKEMIDLPCECGCGCHFDLEYEVVAYEGCFIHYTDKEMRLIK